MSDIIPRYDTPQVLTDMKIRKQAKEMFLEGVLPTDIAQALYVDFKELHRLIFGRNGKGTEMGCWYLAKKEHNLGITGKENVDGNSVQGWTKVKYYMMNRTESRLMNLVQRSLEEFEGSDYLLSDIKDIRAALDALGLIDKVKRLEDGLPTDHIKIDHGLSLSEISKQYEKKGAK